jgi:hypothetical protein
MVSWNLCIMPKTKGGLVLTNIYMQGINFGSKIGGRVSHWGGHLENPTY